MKIEPTLNGPIKEFWEADKHPQALERTKTRFSRVEAEPFLMTRGLPCQRLLQLMKVLPEGAYVAGGYMAAVLQGDTKEAHDIDIFFRDELAFRETFSLFEEPPAKPDPDNEQDQMRPGLRFDEDKDEVTDDYDCVRDYKVDTDIEALDTSENMGKTIRFVSFKSTAGGPTVQLIKLAWYPEGAEHVIDTFDLTVAQVATDGKDLVFNPVSILDICRKHIILHRMSFPSSTLRRIIKYSAKGYHACPGSLANIAKLTTETLTKNPEVNEEPVYLD